MSKAIKRNNMLKITTSAFALATSTGAYAQGEEMQASTPVDSNIIIVQAQRRDESLQDVPLSVTAIEPERLEQLSLRSVDELPTVTPGFVFDKGYSYAQTFIRGIGSGFPNPGLEPAVATYIDGSYASRGFGSLYEMLDVSTVQVLKGPQGTLYGRNATGGAVLINSRDPEDTFSASFVGEAGSREHQLVEAVLNVPAGDTLAFRFAGRYRHDGGYVENLFTGNELGRDEAFIGRARMKWEPSPNFSAVLTFQYDENDGSTPPAAQRLGLTTTRTDFEGPFAQYNGVPIFTCSGCDTSAFPGTMSPVSGFYQTDQNEPVIRGVDGTHSTSYFYNLKMNASFGNVDIESVTAFRNQDAYGISELDFTRASLFHYGQYSGAETFTQDIVATVEVSPWLDLLVGGSYADETGYFDVTFDGIDFQAAAAASASGQLPSGINVVDTKNWAIFGEVTLEPTPGLKLIAGGRYSEDKRTIVGDFNDTIVAAFGLPAAGFERSDSFDSFTPRFVVSYDTGPLNLYASYSKGFKSGGYASIALVRPEGDLVVQPEKIESYEVGAKYVSPDGRLRANLAGFYYDYTDVQVTVIRLELGGSVVVNGAAAEGKGIEFDFDFAANDWLTIFGSAAYLDTEFKDFQNAAGAGPVGDPTMPPAIFNSLDEDLTGFPLQRSPKFSGNIGFNAETPISDDWTADLTGVLSYSDGYDFSPGAGGPLRTDFQPSRTLVNMSGNLHYRDQYSIGFYVKNLLNEEYLTFRQSAAFFGAFDYVAPPRTYGIRVKVRY